MRGRRRTLAAVLLVLALVGGGPAAAQEPGEDDELDDLIEAALAAESTFISHALANVEVDSLPYRQAFTRFIYAVEALAAVQQARLTAEHNLVQYQADEVRLTGELEAAVARKKGFTVDLAGLRARLREIAVVGYVGGKGTFQTALAFDVGAVTRSHERMVLVDTVGHDARIALDAATEALQRAVTEVADLREQRRAVRDAIARATTDRDAAIAEEARLALEVEERERDVDRTRVLAYVVGADFVLVTMDAYYRAAQAVPDCGLSWWALAGIGKVESRHGQSKGAIVRANGDTAPHIIGIPLDGTNGTALITDTDGGLLDGDPVYDRAVGPMQFIPSTWDRFATDGDGDGDADPHNLYDAARSAAAYICRYAPLDDDEGLRRAYFAYNHSNSYVERVLSWAHQYETTIPVPPP